MSKKHEKLVKYVVSPGTMSGIGQAPDAILPTGEKTLVMSEHATIQFTQRPDPSGSIILLSMPFFEAPWARVYLDANGDFDRWEAIPLPTYARDPDRDPLRTNNIYGYRFVANGLTGYNTSAVLNASGSVTIASLPLSLDCKIVYDTQNPAAVPLSYIKCLDRLPLNSDEIASITNNMVTHTALEGSYAVLRHTDPNIPFAYRNSDQNKAVFSAYYRDQTGLQPVDEGGGQMKRLNYLCWSDQNEYGQYITDENQVPIPVSVPSCMDLCITCYSGLSNNDRITFKGVAAWEFIPKMNSPKIPQCKIMKPKNSLFLDMLNAAELSTPSLGKASDNSFGSFIKGAINFLGSNAPVIKELAAMIPNAKVQAVVSRVADALPKINAAVNRANQAASNANAAAGANRATRRRRQ
jgi:hypothetical protein